MKRTLLFSAVTVLLLVPVAIFAQETNNGLVPCSGVDCGACHILQLVQNVIRWLIGFIVAASTLIFAYGGLLITTSGGDTGKINQAKGLMTNVVIGLFILLSGWLIIDTVMRIFVNESNLGRPWHTIECVAQPVPTAPVDACAEAENPQICRCEASGGTWNISDGRCEAAECPIPPLSPITDSLAQRMEVGQSVIWDNTDQRLRACATAFTNQIGRGSVTSAYRPQSYQTHLWEIRDRWCTQGLQNNTTEACSSVKSAVQAEVNKHFGANWQCGAVAQTNSTHTSGTGVDISGIANHSDPAVVQAAQASCLTWNNYPDDPHHYTLRSGCTCN